MFSFIKRNVGASIVDPTLKYRPTGLAESHGSQATFEVLTRFIHLPGLKSLYQCAFPILLLFGDDLAYQCGLGSFGLYFKEEGDAAVGLRHDRAADFAAQCR